MGFFFFKKTLFKQLQSLTFNSGQNPSRTGSKKPAKAKETFCKKKKKMMSKVPFVSQVASWVAVIVTVLTVAKIEERSTTLRLGELLQIRDFRGKRNPSLSQSETK